MISEVDFRRILKGLAVAALETPYQQLKLMKLRQFADFMRKRDCGFGLSDWWRMGVLRPAVIDGPVDDDLLEFGILDVESPTTDHEHFADGRLVLGEMAYSHGAGAPLRNLEDRAWFHPLQLWQAYLLRRHLGSLAISPSILFGPEERYMEIYTQKRADDRQAVERLITSWKYVDSFRLATFAIAVAPLVLFRMSGQIISDLSKEESYEEFWSWRGSHDPEVFLAKIGARHEDLRRWNEELSYAAYGLDPLRGWYDLTRHVAWQSWQGVQGEALLAHDLYVLAEIIRQYADEFLGLTLPEEDELWHGSYVKQIKEAQYGYPKSSQRHREVRRRVAREFGLDGDVRLVWVVEVIRSKALSPSTDGWS